MDPRYGVVAVALAACLTIAAPASTHAQDESLADRLHFHGYGEFHYNNPQIGTMDEDAIAEADVHRLVLGWTYEFTDAFRLDAEIDFEHAATEIELEYAHIDYDLKPTLALRAGSVLMPVGPLNEFHEPPLYYSVERPYVENTIMPTTWQEMGLGLVGRSGSLGYRAYVVTGLNAAGFTSLSGIRGGRTHVAEAPAEDLAGVARLEYSMPSGLQLGASGYYGGADQGDSTLGDVTVGIVNGDARFRKSGLDLRGVIYKVFLDADDLSTALGEPIGESMLGWYAEAAYDLLRRDKDASRTRSLFIFGRFEDFDTNDDVDD
ncbi:MAG TPA: porin, partial [Candidatus Eisenbacteria bacterium]|nr:porin [Candidatus Eisenbacteria bacterium]